MSVKKDAKEKIATAKASIGRPRTSVPERDELIKLGKDLVKWATEPTEELRFHYSQWYLKHGYVSTDWKHMLEKPEFRIYYEQARDGIARRYIDGTIHPSLAQRFLRIYMPHVKEEENETKIFESNLKSQEAQNISEADTKRFEQMMALIANKQK
jgi:hypothetical protein